MSTETKIGVLAGESRIEAGERAAFKVLLAISFCHLLNDAVQSLLPAIYPLLRNSFHLDFGQVGLIAFTSTFTASLLQPLVGLYSDRRNQPYLLALGMGVTLVGLLTLSRAPGYGTVLLAAGLVGVGSAVFHPESSRVARMASGGLHGTAQSIFQVGGNAGSALGPLLAAYVLPKGQSSVAWFSLLALVAIVMLIDIGAWTARRRAIPPRIKGSTVGGPAAVPATPLQIVLSKKRVAVSLAVLIILMFSKFFYLASLTSYYTFYLIGKFHISVQSAQIYLFVFLGAVAAGTFFGGPVGDRFGRKFVIWYSILGVLPFTLLLPYANLFWTAILSVIIGLVLASAFSTILVFGQELVPGKIGTVSGFFFGLAFGLGGIGAALLGKLADLTSINFVYHLCSFLPALGILTVFLPNQTPSSFKST